MLQKSFAWVALLTALFLPRFVSGQSPQPSSDYPRLRHAAAQQPNIKVRPLGRVPKGRPAHVKAPQPEPCWRVAGISPEVIARRRAIEQETQARVRQICGDSSLSDQQKRQEIHQVRQAASQEILGLTTPEQRAAVKQCNEERAEQHRRIHPVAHMPRPARPNPHPHPAGPCAVIG